MNHSLTVILPLAGRGERFARSGYVRPKPLVRVLGRPLILRVVESLGLSPDDHLLVVHHTSLERDGFSALLLNAFPRLQVRLHRLGHRTRGAAETVLRGLEVIPDDLLNRPTLVVDGDCIFDPQMVDGFRSRPGNTIFCAHDPGPHQIYSYVEVDDDLRVRRIAEKERISPHACIGAYGFKVGTLLRSGAHSIVGTDRRKDGEYYLSHVVQVLLEQGQEVRAEPVRNWACLGTPAQLQFWCRRQVLLSQLKRLHATFVPIHVLLESGESNPLAPSIEPYREFLSSLGSDLSWKTRSPVTKEGLEEFPVSTPGRMEREQIERETGYYLPEPIQARSWHHIKVTGNVVEKSGPQSEALHEIYWYRNLPRQLSPHVPSLRAQRTAGSTTRLELDRVAGAPFSHLLLYDLLAEKDLDTLLQVLSEFHATDLSGVPPLPDVVSIYDNYLRKISGRYDFIRSLDLSGTEESYRRIVEWAVDYEASDRGQEAVIHGDPVFTNTFLTPAGTVVLVDPKGHLNGSSTLRGDANYDLAKVYQSLVGYDAVLLGHDPPPGATRLLDRYHEWLARTVGQDRMDDIRWITAGLYLSLLPLHEARHRPAFLRLCQNLLDTIRN